MASVDLRLEGWSRAIRSLRSLASLRDDWDGLGARSPSGDIVSAAIDLAQRLRTAECDLPASATATPAGSILFEWHDVGSYFEMEIASAATVEWMAVNRDNVASHGSFTLQNAVESARAATPLFA